MRRTNLAPPGVTMKDAMVELSKLAKELVDEHGVRQMSRLTGIPATTLSLRTRLPADWKLRELRAVFEATAEGKSAAVKTRSLVSGSKGKRRQAKVIHGKK